MQLTVPHPQVLDFSDAKLYRTSLFLVAGNIVLPLFLHLFGLAGPVFLPMYFFSLLAGLMYGWRTGLVVGFFTPLLNNTLTGMPAMPVLTYIVLKSSLLGLISGLMIEKFKKLNIWQLTLGVLLAVQLLSIGIGYLWGKPNGMLFQDLKIGYPGLLLQLVLIPFLINKFNHEKKVFESNSTKD